MKDVGGRQVAADILPACSVVCPQRTLDLKHFTRTDAVGCFHTSKRTGLSEQLRWDNARRGFSH